MDINKFFWTLEQNHYAPLILFILEGIAIFYALKNLERNTIGKLFIFYLILDLVILTLDLILYSSRVTNVLRLKFVISTNNIISLTELIVYYTYFQDLLKNKTWYNFLKSIKFVVIILSIPLTILIILLPVKTTEYPTNLFGVIQLLLLIPPCIKFFQEILNTESSLRLFSRPSFFITSGVFFYSASSIPFYLIKKILDNIQSKYILDIAAAFFYTPIIINIIFLILAFKCKKAITI